MKLPDDPKERQQWYVLMGIFGAIALYAAYMAVNAIFLKPQEERNKNISHLEEQVRDADDDVGMVPILKEKNQQHVTAITEMSDNYVLHPQLGNYLIPAEEFIRKQEAAAEVKVLEVKEIGINEFPPPEPPKPVKDSSGHAKVVAAPKKDYAFKIYTARVEVDNGYHDLLKLIKQIEAANPFVSISSMTLAPKDDSPFAHSMSFDVQWPIWNPTRHTEKIMQQLDSEVFRSTIKTNSKKPAAKKTAEKKSPEKKEASPAPVSAAVEGELKKLGVPIE